MKKITAVSVLGLALFVSACGGSSGSDGKGGGEEGSNIQYLKSNHTSYTQSNNQKTPAPVKDDSALTISWIVSAKTEANAAKLFDHIKFMGDKLQQGEKPRAWDKLFLLEAYMKTSHRYTTELSREGTTNVLITKTATDRCAYQVISAHSDAVSGDFFARGVINVDYSPIAENIINSNERASSKTELEEYVRANQKAKGH